MLKELHTKHGFPTFKAAVRLTSVCGGASWNIRRYRNTPEV